jgi:hypothetical protein
MKKWREPVFYFFQRTKIKTASFDNSGGCFWFRIFWISLTQKQLPERAFGNQHKRHIAVTFDLHSFILVPHTKEVNAYASPCTNQVDTGKVSPLSTFRIIFVVCGYVFININKENQAHSLGPDCGGNSDLQPFGVARDSFAKWLAMGYCCNNSHVGLFGNIGCYRQNEPEGEPNHTMVVEYSWDNSPGTLGDIFC